MGNKTTPPPKCPLCGSEPKREGPTMICGGKNGYCAIEPENEHAGPVFTIDEWMRLAAPRRRRKARGEKMRPAECPYDELAARWAWVNLVPGGWFELSLSAKSLRQEGMQRLQRGESVGMGYEIAMSLACGDER